MNPPSAVLGGGGVHGKVCWLIAYIYINRNQIQIVDNDVHLANYISTDDTDRNIVCDFRTFPPTFRHVIPT